MTQVATTDKEHSMGTSDTRKKIIAIGNSAGLVIDRSLLRLLGRRAGSLVDIETDGRTLLVQRSKVRDLDIPLVSSNENADTHNQSVSS